MKTIELFLEKDKEFYQTIDSPFTIGDVAAYKIRVNVSEDISGGNLVVKAKRKDGAVIVDSTIFVGTSAEYVLKNNMYSVVDEVVLDLQVVYNGSIWTSSCLTVPVRVGAGEPDLSGDDRVPVLENFISDAQIAASEARSQGQQAMDIAGRMTPFYVSNEQPINNDLQYIWFDTADMNENVMLTTTSLNGIDAYSLAVGSGTESITNAVDDMSEADADDVTITSV